MLDIDAGYHGTRCEVAVGDTFHVTLDETPTTGYRWQLLLGDKPLCVLIESTFEPGGQTPGLGGKHHWTFQAAEAGLTQLEFTSRRSWEKEGERRFQVGLLIR